MAREHINNDQREREEDIGLPFTSKDNVRLAGEKGDKEELGNVPRSISAPSRNVDELLGSSNKTAAHSRQRRVGADGPSVQLKTGDATSPKSTGGNVMLFAGHGTNDNR